MAPSKQTRGKRLKPTFILASQEVLKPVIEGHKYPLKDSLRHFQ